MVCYGAAGLKKDNEVVKFLAEDKHAKSVNIFRDG